MRNSIDCATLVKSLLLSGYTTKSLGAEVGLSQPSISRLASGRTRRTHSDAFQRLVELAGGQVQLPDPSLGSLSGGEVGSPGIRRAA